MTSLPLHAARAMDCAAARTPVEKAICSDPALKKLDEDLNRAYQARVAAGPPAGLAQLKTEQRAWLKARDAKCKAAVPCLRSETSARLEVLSKPPPDPLQVKELRGRVHASLPPFVFRLHYRTDPDDPERPFVTRIETRREDVAAPSTLIVPGEDENEAPGLPWDDTGFLVDANFDGFKDLMLPSAGNRSYNPTSTFWVFVPATGQFQLDRKLSEILLPVIDPAKQAIHSQSKDGCCTHYEQTYRFVDGKLTLVEEEKRMLDEQDPEGPRIRVVRKRINGKLREVSREKVTDE
jgi:uncharacterized protein